MNSIPRIPEEDQVMVLDTGILDALPVAPDYDKPARDRMIEGAEKYGLSWNEVNLKEDLRQEFLDALNYPRMMVSRLAYFREDIPDEKRLEYIIAVGEILVRVEDCLKLLEDLPDFEGMTSAEWAEKHNG